MKAYEVVREWAEQNHVRFVSRTPGQCTTDTVSKAALEELVSAATEPLLERIAALEAKLAQRVPDGLIQEAVEAISGLLSKIRRDAPQLSGKAMGYAEDVIARISAAPAAPEQQEPPPVTQPVHRATMACVECGGVLGHTRMCRKFTGYGGEVAQAPNAQQAEPPPGWKTVVVPEDVGPEPDWEDVRYQAETATGIELPRAVFSIVIREVRRWMAAQQAEAQEPFAWYFPADTARCFAKGYVSELYQEQCSPSVAPLFTRPQPAQLQALSEEEVKAAATQSVASGKLLWTGFEKDADGRYTVPVLSPSDVKFSHVIQSALAAKNGAVLK